MLVAVASRLAARHWPGSRTLARMYVRKPNTEQSLVIPSWKTLRSLATGPGSLRCADSMAEHDSPARSARARLLEACEAGDAEAAQAALAAGAGAGSRDAVRRGAHGTTVTCSCADDGLDAGVSCGRAVARRAGGVALRERLLGRLAALAAQAGRHVIHVAAMSGHTAVCRALLEAGCSAMEPCASVSPLQQRRDRSCPHWLAGVLR